MTRPLMPKATAVWLIDNTALTFEQISDFCGLHMLEIQAIADGEVAVGMQGLDPVRGGELDGDLLKECETDPEKRLQITKVAADHAKQQRKKKTRYTPVSKRQDRPDAIAWLLKNYPELTDAQISKLVGTTKPTINSIRERTHWNISNITAQNPVGLGLCSGNDLEKAISTARARAGTVAASSDGGRPETTIKDGSVVASSVEEVPGRGTETPAREAESAEPTVQDVFGSAAASEEESVEERAVSAIDEANPFAVLTKTPDEEKVS